MSGLARTVNMKVGARLAGIVALGIASGLAMESSVNPIFFRYSLTRLVVIGLIAVLGGGLILASRSCVWSGRVVAILTGIATAVGFLELVLWWNPFMIPDPLFWRMPLRVVDRAVALDIQRGSNDPSRRFSFDQLSRNYVSEGYLRHYVPRVAGMFQTEDIEDRWVHVEMDEIGFRNPPGLYSSSDQLDVILLGDSFTRGTSRVTMSEFLSQLAGVRVYSLGDLGGAPQQWALAFERYGVQKKPRLVIINFYEGNDLADALRLQEVIDKNLPLDVYYNGVSDRVSFRLLHSSCVLSLIYASLFGRHEVPPMAIVRIGSDPEARIPLSNRSPGPRVLGDSDDTLRNGLQIIERVLQHIRSSCSCRVMISYIPSVTSVYADRAAGIEGTSDPQYWIESAELQRNLSALLLDVARRNALLFVDVTPKIRVLAMKERLYGDRGHFSQRGYQRYAELLYDAIREADVLGPAQQKAGQYGD